MSNLVSLLKPHCRSLRAAAVQVFKSGGLYLTLSIIFVQGVTFIVQLFIAKALTPELFGISRTVEAVLAAALVLAQCGLPSLAIRDVAILSENQTKYVARLIGSIVLVAFFVATIIFMLASYINDYPMAAWLKILAPVLVIASINRAIIGVLQGGGHIAEVARMSVISSTLGLISSVILVSLYGLAGWAGGKYLTEFMLIVVMAFALNKKTQINFTAGKPSATMVRTGAQISAGLVFRSLLDSALLPVLLFFSVTPSVLGDLGLSLLMTFPILLIPGVISNLLIPRLARARNDVALLRRSVIEGIGLTLVISIVISLIFAVLGSALVSFFYPAYDDSIALLLLLLISMPLRAAAMPIGGLFIALNVNRPSIIVGGIGLIVFLCLCWILVPAFGATGGVLAVIGAESVFLVGFIIAARHVINRI